MLCKQLMFTCFFIQEYSAAIVYKKNISVNVPAAVIDRMFGAGTASAEVRRLGAKTLIPQVNKILGL